MQLIATEQTKDAGIIVYWSLSGRVDIGVLAAEWIKAGFDGNMLPTSPSEGLALRRAMLTQAESRLLARPLNRGKSWLLVKETPDTDTAAYQIACKATLQDDGKVEIIGENGYISHIRNAYEYALSHYDVADVSSWLTWLAHGVKAVALRPRGGVYFVPRDAVNTFLTQVAVLERVSPECHVYRIPAMQSSDAVAAILAAVQHEAESQLADLSADIENQVGNRALENRKQECKRLLEKVSYYETLLQGNLNELKTKIEEMNTSLIQAVLMITEDK